MVHYVFWWLYSICLWSKAIPYSEKVHPSAGSDLFRFALHWKFFDFAWVFPVGFVFVPEATCGLRVALSIGTFIALCDVWGERHFVYGDGVLDSIFFQGHRTSLRRYYIKWGNFLWQ